ncbi:DUF4159 domain-containing protein [Acidimangrovimonas pyrenivorans]|uniref:DUF4159 domain-containing protein n=1 Tax=Acidimangrovimonas pyrenivorans TaxID=2030798 RepID=A0ABV7AN48_9RHOB
MWVLGPIGFTTPWLLLGLAALPLLWILLRAVPPAPIRRRFPGVALLLGLKDDSAETDRTPWWLLLLRMLAIAAAIVAFAGPVLNPKVQHPGQGPLLIVFDGSWASARDWQRRLDRVTGLLEDAGNAGRRVAVVSLTDLPEQARDGDGAPQFMAADAWQSRLPGIKPVPWAPDDAAVEAWARGLTGRFDTYWLSDGLARDSRPALHRALEAHGAVTVFESPRPALALRPPVFADGAIQLTALRALTGSDAKVDITAQGTGPNGGERQLATVSASFPAGADTAEVKLGLPPELRNRINRFEIAGQHSAGAVSLTDDALKRRKVALMAGSRDREGLQLLSPLHYLREALKPTADIIEGNFEDILLASPDVIILADVAKLSPQESKELLDWTDKGGLLLRFAGPRLAASDISRDSEDPLMPVRLRIGGRTVGGAMSWGEPKKLRPFAKGSPFYGLTIPGDVTVNAQVLAQPDPTLAARTIASLADGTPLVTRKPVGKGQVVLFHVTANAEWSTLPLSGLFVRMLDRLAVSTRPARPTAEELKGTTWVPAKLLDGFGALRDAGQTAGIAGEALAAAKAGPETPPGLYRSDDRRVALNIIGQTDVLTPAAWPAGTVIEGLAAARETALKGAFLSAALLLLLLDLIASLLLSGRLRGARAGAVTGAAAVVLLALALPGQVRAQDGTPAGDAFAIRATSGVVLAHVVTGNAEVDRIAQAGLQGLSDVLTQRTSVEPETPMAVDIEKDELAFFPFLYWPVTAAEPLPSQAAYVKLNDYLRTGGMILFDTRDADIAVGTTTTPNARRLQQIAAGLDIPALAPVPPDHVLTRSFYLIQDFPGRYSGGKLWVEAAPPGAKKVEGMPFRNLNDGVTPVVIGSNDYAAAWAVDGQGRAMFPIGRGYGGERQRELAYRFGVNLIMHVLTGNYKSDQVHVPALLERLGQ